MRMSVARLCWWLSEVFMDFGYRIAYGMSYRAFLLLERHVR